MPILRQTQLFRLRAPEARLLFILSTVLALVTLTPPTTISYLLLLELSLR